MYDFLCKISDPVGMVGVVLILIGYFFISTGRWSSDNLPFQWLNFIGAWLILFSLYFHRNWSSVVIEVAWIIISMVGIYRLLRSSIQEKP